MLRNEGVKRDVVVVVVTYYRIYTASQANSIELLNFTPNDEESKNIVPLDSELHLS